MYLRFNLNLEHLHLTEMATGEPKQELLKSAELETFDFERETSETSTDLPGRTLISICAHISLMIHIIKGLYSKEM